MFCKWLAYGGVEEEWDAYIARVNQMGMEEYLDIYQRTYDNAYSK